MICQTDHAPVRQITCVYMICLAMQFWFTSSCPMRCVHDSGVINFTMDASSLGQENVKQNCIATGRLYQPPNVRGDDLFCVGGLCPLTATLHKQWLPRQLQVTDRLHIHAATLDPVLARLQHSVAGAAHHRERMRVRREVGSTALSRRNGAEAFKSKQLAERRVRRRARGPNNKCKSHHLKTQAICQRYPWDLCKLRCELLE